jgi:two-component system response regulator HupR/HoxA
MTPEPAQPPAAERPRVLLVDDEVPLLAAMRAALEGEFAVDTATTAAEAEKLLAARTYLALVCDHLLPGEAGLDFLVRMRERHPGVRRILLTGYINPELLSRSVAVAELAACLIKPVPSAELLRVVRGAVRR